MRQKEKNSTGIRTNGGKMVAVDLIHYTTGYVEKVRQSSNQVAVRSELGPTWFFGSPVTISSAATYLIIGLL